MTEPRTLGVVGTLVWDRILDRDGRSEPVEEWGGIGYALAALTASLPEGWQVLPILKVGKDLAEEARRFVRELPRMNDAGMVVCVEPNNRVELRYQSDARRVERLTGGVPPWTWPELAPLVDLCDALYVNFISGFEMELETARALRRGYRGPIYADLHSLFLGMNRQGFRVPQSLEALGRVWFRCFDGVQMNEDEFELLGAPGERSLAARGRSVLGPDLKLITCHAGPRGSGLRHRRRLRSGPGYVAERRALSQRHRSVPTAARWSLSEGAPGRRSHRVRRRVGRYHLRPRLLSGDSLEDAMGRGQQPRGRRNVEHQRSARDSSGTSWAGSPMWRKERERHIGARVSGPSDRRCVLRFSRGRAG